MIETILSKYLFNALLLSLVSIGYSFLKNKLGEDIASTIKEAILNAMLWAENVTSLPTKEINRIKRNNRKTSLYHFWLSLSRI